MNAQIAALEKDLRQSLRTGYLFGNHDEPLGHYGLRLVRVIQQRLADLGVCECTDRTPDGARYHWMSDDGTRIDWLGLVDYEQPVNIGWATVTLHADATVTRTCTGCGVQVRTAYNPVTHQAETARIDHAAGCPVMARFGNNPGRS